MSHFAQQPCHAVAQLPSQCDESLAVLSDIASAKAEAQRTKAGMPFFDLSLKNPQGLPYVRSARLVAWHRGQDSLLIPQFVRNLGVPNFLQRLLLCRAQKKLGLFNNVTADMAASIEKSLQPFVLVVAQ